MNTCARGHYQCQNYFIRPRRIGDPDLHSIKMAADVGGVDMGYGHVKPCARATDLFGRWDNGLRPIENFAHGVTTRHVPQRSVLEFSACADDRSFAVSLHDLCVAAQFGHQQFRHFKSEGFQIVHELLDRLHICTREWI
jgi:hypothetical protein